MQSIIKKSIFLFILFGINVLSAQEPQELEEGQEYQEVQYTLKNQANFKLGEGLNFSFNEGAYQFNLGGFIQPAVNYEKIEDMDAEYEFNSKRTYLIVGGKAVKEKVSFLIQTDFSLSQSLLDAWIAYHPFQWLTITGGQKQTFLNNREMLYREDKLQFTDRSYLSRLYSNTGREFGLFVEGKFGSKIGIAPSFAVTSGDGRNSFGQDSRDADLGGLKIGARLDVYPLGYFSEGNNEYTADIIHEESLKILVGAAVSENNGASGSNGEDHGAFLFYDGNGQNLLPDYSQFFADVLLKYKGFSFLGEYASSGASDLGVPFLDIDATELLAPQQISEYLVLGDSYCFQLGYVTKSGFSFDLRYEGMEPEFKDNEASLLPEASSYTFGFTKYFLGHNLKMQAAVGSIDLDQGANQTVAEFLVQIVF
ncbi:hypothetical protein [Mangrovimonas aestuarii]|uniref:hypothetical protein n=1 Tax=Mangrovimonas aestuarii TaxID=3018443 RepID=UPI0023788A4F|nr:hypothetical protein [Mangrovimonas aestuarii]